MLGSVLLVDSVTWPWVFVFIGVASLACLVLVALTVPESRGAVSGRLDVVGAALAFIAVGGIVAGVNEGPVAGWSAPLTDVCLALGTLAGAAFVVWERRTQHPLLDMHVFLNRSLSGSSITLVAMFAADFGMFFLLYQDRAYVYGESALRTTLVLLVCFVTFPPSMPIGTRWAARSGLRPVMTSAMLVCAVGLVLASTMGLHASVWVMIVALNIFWFGVGLAMTPATRGILDALPSEAQGVASAVNDLTRELGVAIGVAAIGSAFTMGYRHQISGVAATLPDGLAEAVRRSPATALAALTGPGSTAALHTVREAVVTGWRVGLLVGVGLLLLAALGAWLVIPAGIAARAEAPARPALVETEPYPHPQASPRAPSASVPRNAIGAGERAR
jgi:predicted MFS family arabinose efflux permease